MQSRGINTSDTFIKIHIYEENKFKIIAMMHIEQKTTQIQVKKYMHMLKNTMNNTMLYLCITKTVSGSLFYFNIDMKP